MYKKPIVTVDAGLAEGVYAASGAKGTLNVTYHGVWCPVGEGVRFHGQKHD